MLGNSLLHFTNLYRLLSAVENAFVCVCVCNNSVVPVVRDLHVQPVTKMFSTFPKALSV